LGQMPGMDKMEQQLRELMTAKNNPTLKMDGGVYAPGLAQAMQQMQRPGQSVAFNLDPNAPLVEMHMLVSEISTDAVPNSVFDVPAGYQAAPVEELVKAMIPGGPPAMPAVR
jgi:hypothetical protein